MPRRRGRCEYVPRLKPASYAGAYELNKNPVWDSKPPDKGAPIKWIELKTSAEIRNDRDMENFERKLLKFWIQSFLLGVPKIIVGFRSKEGRLLRLEEIETASIPFNIQQRGRAKWDGNTCINFASAFLDCGFPTCYRD